jgi:hypothetical protein
MGLGEGFFPFYLLFTLHESTSEFIVVIRDFDYTLPSEASMFTVPI